MRTVVTGVAGVAGVAGAGALVAVTDGLLLRLRLGLRGGRGPSRFFGRRRRGGLRRRGLRRRGFRRCGFRRRGFRRCGDSLGFGRRGGFGRRLFLGDRRFAPSRMRQSEVPGRTTAPRVYRRCRCWPSRRRHRCSAPCVCGQPLKPHPDGPVKRPIAHQKTGARGCTATHRQPSSAARRCHRCRHSRPRWRRRRVSLRSGMRDESAVPPSGPPKTTPARRTRGVADASPSARRVACQLLAEQVP